jgi:hypothetical protein
MKTSRLALTVLAIALLAALAFAASGSAAAEQTTIRFEELEKGSTFAFVDNAPKSELDHGFPTTISAGDQIVSTTPLVEGQKKIGHLASTCVATKTSKSFDRAGFLCQGTFFLGNSTLIAAASIGNAGGTEGAITGGTGIYAGAHGIFVSKEGKGRSKVTVTLSE